MMPHENTGEEYYLASYGKSLFGIIKTKGSQQSRDLARRGGRGMTKRKCTEKSETSIWFYKLSDRTVKNAKSKRGRI